MTIPGRSAGQSSSVQVLLVEDDPGDALLFEELLRPEIPEVQIEVARTIREAEALLEWFKPDACVLDLGLPGCIDLQALTELHKVDADLATVVLTGRSDHDLGPEALSLGAQDYLLKGHESGPAIARSIRFAIERRNNERSTAALTLAEAKAQEQLRMEAALVARPALSCGRAKFNSRYVAARAGALGGDFLDCVQIDDTTIRLVVGDVAGHGTDQAAMGVTLRAGWRALALGSPSTTDVLPALERLLISERRSRADFVTVIDVVVKVDTNSMVIRCAGHPPPYVSGLGLVDDSHRTRPLGIAPDREAAPGTELQLDDGFTMFLYTDGLFELRRTDGLIGSIDDVESIFSDAGKDPSVEEILLSANRGAETWRDDVAIARFDLTS